MNDKTAKTIFTVLGVLQVLWSIFLAIGLCVSIVGLIGAEAAETYIESLGETVDAEYNLGMVIVSAILTALALGLNIASAIGFFKLKKWQPPVFTAVVVLAVIEMIINIVQVGFGAGTLVSGVFFLLWVGSLILVWSKKEMFKN